jgi:drug/metabolite transporter (DMT)-like permease
MSVHISLALVAAWALWWVSTVLYGLALRVAVARDPTSPDAASPLVALALSWACFAAGLLLCACMRPQSVRDALSRSLWADPWVHVQAVAHWLGTLCTTEALIAGSLPLVYAIKACETLTTALAARALLGWRISWPQAAALVPVVAGLGLASLRASPLTAGARALVAGAGAALLSNAAFSLRAAAAKRALASARGAPSVDALGLLAAAHGAGLLLTSAALALVLLLGQGAGLAPLAALVPHARAVALAALGCAGLNAGSFLVLRDVSAVTHALGNVLNRVAVVAVATWAAGDALSPLQTIGAVVATAGVGAYFAAGAAAAPAAVEAPQPDAGDPWRVWRRVAAGYAGTLLVVLVWASASLAQGDSG